MHYATFVSKQGLTNFSLKVEKAMPGILILYNQNAKPLGQRSYLQNTRKKEKTTTTKKKTCPSLLLL